MKPRTNRLIVALSLVLAGALAFGLGAAAWLTYSSLQRASAINATREWGRLAPFPALAQDLTVTTHGSIFTREFRTSFVAPPEDIEAWLQNSPGTREAVVTTAVDGVRHFQITPGSGAEFAEVTVDDTQHRVFIRVYWS
jgi:hypothetical protein